MESIVRIEREPVRTLEELQNDLFVELAKVEIFPDGECALCGSAEDFRTSEVHSEFVDDDLQVPLCLECRRNMEEQSIEQYIRKVRDEGSPKWSKILSFNLRKVNWISKVAFDLLKEESLR
ncbi:MAG: hypothetical protein ACMUIE_06200 [Thermoplasmatota archaeon]